MKTFYLMILVVKSQTQNIKTVGLLLASLFLLAACSSKVEYQRFSGATMGTRYHITAELPANASYEDLQNQIDLRLKEVNHSMSTWQKDSFISQFNQAKLGDVVTVDQDFINVLEISRKVYQESGGAFDPAVGRLVNMWGFGPRVSVANLEKIPSDEAIEKALKSIDFMDVTYQGLQVKKTIDTYLDFSGVAKGYGVDQIARVLEKNGVKNYMVEIGGEVSTHGVNDEGKPWHIGIESPGLDAERAMIVLKIGDKGTATSGDYRNFFNLDGKHYSHIIDPRTGKPTTSRLASVTVITDTVALSDAWATALTVVGKEKALELAEKYHLAVYLIEHDGKNFVTAYSKTMQQYMN